MPHSIQPLMDKWWDAYMGYYNAFTAAGIATTPSFREHYMGFDYFAQRSEQEGDTQWVHEFFTPEQMEFIQAEYQESYLQYIRDNYTQRHEKPLMSLMNYFGLASKYGKDWYVTRPWEEPTTPTTPPWTPPVYTPGEHIERPKRQPQRGQTPSMPTEYPISPPAPYPPTTSQNYWERAQRQIQSYRDRTQPPKMAQPSKPSYEIKPMKDVLGQWLPSKEGRPLSYGTKRKKYLWG